MIAIDLPGFRCDKLVGSEKLRMWDHRKPQDSLQYGMDEPAKIEIFLNNQGNCGHKLSPGPWDWLSKARAGTQWLLRLASLKQ